MAELGPAVDIERLRGKKLRQRVYRVGIELEGGWRKLPTGARLAHDGSIHFTEDDITSGLQQVGELPSPVMDVKDFPAWMTKYYPHFVNATCGMHVHMSFMTALTYQRLMDARFPATILASMTSWAKGQKLSKAHPIWERLRGESRYCKHEFSADAQVKNTSKDFDQRRDGHRYTVINYCYSRTGGSLECRLLPMMHTAEQGIAAVQEIIDTTNAFLVATSAKERRHTSTVDADGDSYREEIRVRV